MPTTPRCPWPAWRPSGNCRPYWPAATAPSPAIRATHRPWPASAGGSCVAARPASFARHKADLVRLIDEAITGQHALLDELGGERLYRAAGCLQVVRDGSCSASALEAMAETKRADGVACEALGPGDVRGLEPELSAEGLKGALYFPETRSLRDPLSLSRRLYRALEGEGFTHLVAHASRRSRRSASCTPP
ncbi:MAG: FAD-dependent oxidoreductase [Halomonas sp.]|nr:FAD-dependent oxidoreductase [Halomonas sp.]